MGRRLTYEEDELIESLRGLGLTRLQATVYLALRRLGIAYARDLTAELGVNRADVYRTLRTLLKLGLVEVRLGNPAKFQAVAPKSALDVLLNRQKEILTALEEEGKRILPKLERIAHEPGMPRLDNKKMFLDLLSGEQVFHKVANLVRDAKYILKMISPRGLFLHWQSDIYDAESHTAQRGAKIRILTQVTPQQYSSIASIRHLDDIAARLRYIIVDEAQLILPVSSPPQGLKDPVVIWSNSAALIDSLIHDFEAAWREAVDAGVKVKELQKSVSR